jgi:hypothetical protein
MEQVEMGSCVDANLPDHAKMRKRKMTPAPIKTV